MIMEIRIAEERDLPQIVAIYNQAVARGGMTADLIPLTVDERRTWFAEHTGKNHPIWVLQTDEMVAGWCSLSPYRPGRMAMRYTAEISYYVAEDFRRRGIGSALIKHAISQCERLGIKTLFALLLDSNTPSVRILEKFGFTRWGHMPNVADFGGRECGHLVYGRRVRE